jgi:hypothetical protein
MADGTVVAPTFSFPVPTNIFQTKFRRRTTPKDADGNPIPQPYYTPVCIKSELMAALINAPRVTVSEFE